MAGARAFIAATKQQWKVALPLAGLPACALAVLLEESIAAHVGTGAALAVMAAATGLGVLGLALPCVSVRCPRCQCKLLRRAVHREAASEWLLWLVRLDRCPECQFAPAAPGLAPSDG